MKIPTGTELKKLVSAGCWALKLIYSTNARLTAALAVASLARGMVPAGLALFARGLINVIVTGGGSETVSTSAVLPWIRLAFAVTLLEAIAPLAQRYCIERLRDDVNIRISLDVLNHAENLELAFFEHTTKRDL